MQQNDLLTDVVSHEFRTPLTCVEQFSEILLGGLVGAVSSEQREYLEIILRNARQLHHMIDDVLEVTRAEAGKLDVQPACMDVCEVVDEVIEAFLARASTQCTRLGWNQRPQVEWLVLADRERVLQALNNLVDNALKFTPENGAVTLRVGEDDNDPCMAKISVADTGCGISPEAQLLVFERLYQEPTAMTSSRGGLGLGLYICHQIVSRHGGRIWVESQPGSGSVFSFTLPRLSLPQLLIPFLNAEAIAPTAQITVVGKVERNRRMAASEGSGLSTSTLTAITSGSSSRNCLTAGSSGCTGSVLVSNATRALRPSLGFGDQ